MSDNSQTKRARVSYLASSWFFFLLVILISIPFYVLGAAGGRLPIATFLPLSAIMAFVPMLAALILVYWGSGVSGAKTFLSRALDYRRIKGVRWVLTALLIMPIVFLLAYGLFRFEARAPPDAKLFPIAEIVAFALMFFVGAIGEELGWQGYAYAGLKNGRSALNAGLILGVIWALWHVIPFAEMGRSVDWIIWQCLGAIALRVIIVWLFVNAGQSVFIAVLFHAMINMPWGVFTTFEPYFDPFVLFVILALIAGIVAALWGPSTLARFRYVRDRA
jgi:membrane protease YdiL (CAAX protease family)